MSQIIKQELAKGKCPVEYGSTFNERTGKAEINVYLHNQDSSKSPEEQHQRILQELTSSSSFCIAEDLMCRTSNALIGSSEGEKRNLIAHFLHDIYPKDATETMLYCQMLALYSQGISYLKRAEKAETVIIQDSFMDSAIKLLRLHNETLEALNRYRRKGEQKVIVQHVNVNRRITISLVVSPP